MVTVQFPEGLQYFPNGRFSENFGRNYHNAGQDFRENVHSGNRLSGIVGVEARRTKVAHVRHSKKRIRVVVVRNSVASCVRSVIERLT
jgi:hypothetical protein